MIKDLPGDVDKKVVLLQRSQPVLPASFGVAFAGVPIEAPFGLARLAGTGPLLNPVQTGYGYPQGAQQKFSSPFLRAITGPWLAYRRVSQTPFSIGSDFFIRERPSFAASRKNYEYDPIVDAARFRIRRDS